MSLLLLWSLVYFHLLVSVVPCQALMSVVLWSSFVVRRVIFFHQFVQHNQPLLVRLFRILQDVLAYSQHPGLSAWCSASSPLPCCLFCWWGRTVSNFLIFLWHDNFFENRECLFLMILHSVLLVYFDLNSRNFCCIKKYKKGYIF